MAVFSLLLFFSCDRRPVYPPVTFDGQSAVVAVGSLKEAVPVFFSFGLHGKRIDFFVVRSGSDISSYFDACRECYVQKRGYRYEKGAMVCRACNVRFPCDRLDTGIGGCYPIKLPGTRAGDRYVISREDLAAGEKYF